MFISESSVVGEISNSGLTENIIVIIATIKCTPEIR